MTIDSVELRVRSQEYGSRTVTFALGEADEFVIEFRDPATLVVAVSNYVGSEHEGDVSLQVQKFVENQDPRRGYAHFSGSSRGGLDENGEQEFKALEPGPYEIVLSIKQDRHRTFPVSRTRIELTEGENRATVEIPPLYDLVLVTDLPKGTRFNLRAADGSRAYFGNSPPVDDEGRVSWKNLSAGEYKVQSFGGGGMNEMLVTVPTGGEVEFTPRVLNAFEVRIHNADGKLAQAGFVDGDVIFAIEGNEFESMIQMQTAVMAAMAKKEPSKLTVDRGGRTIELELQLSTLQDFENSGGNIEPTSR